MTRKLALKDIGENFFAYYKNNKQLKTTNDNIIKVAGLSFAKRILTKLEQEQRKKNSNFIKLFFYSFDLNIKQARIITESIIKYIDTDLVCYRANEGTELEKIQKKLWDPYIKFCEKHYQLNYKKIYTVMPYSQEASNKDKILKIIDSMDKYYLTAFFFLVEITNSIIISLNIIYENISTNIVWKACNLEDEYNQTKWGLDEDFNKKLLFKKTFFIDIIKFIKIIKFKENNGK